ncbi:MAG: permease-like cell division protein FtsX [Clostridia bacterium]|nr:permease-like cell division protein FtsX [Clostridia bacterium]
MGYSPLYFLEQTFKNIVRGKGMDLVSVLVLMSCLLVSGSFYAVNENINYNLESLGALNKILAYIDEEMTDEQIRQIKEEVEGLENVKSVDLISKEQALEDEKNRLGEEYADIFDWLEEGENPYRASLEVEYLSTDGVEELEKALGEIDGVESVQSRANTAQKVSELKKAVSKVFLAMMALLFLVSLFIIVTTVKLALHQRSKEISVMRYVGASALFISIPFLLEGLLIGGLAAVIAFAVQHWIYGAVAAQVGKEFFGIISILPADELSNALLIGFLVIGLATGLVGSIFAVIKRITD